MATMTHDETLVVTRRARVGFGFAALAAASFGLSGALASALLDAGWSPAALVLCRADIAHRYTSTPIYLRAAQLRTRKYGAFEVHRSWTAVEHTEGRRPRVGPADAGRRCA